MKLQSGDTPAHVINKLQQAFPDAYNVVVLTDMDVQPPTQQTATETPAIRVLEDVLDIRFDEKAEETAVPEDSFVPHRRIRLRKPVWQRNFEEFRT